jgi:PQQ-dependent dehydrogenase (methanol/ethanol family)
LLGAAAMTQAARAAAMQVAFTAVFAAIGCRDAARADPPSGRVTLAGAQVHVPPAPEDGEWRKVAKDDANTRYSALDTITASNVASLGVAWTFKTGLERGHEAAPLVIGSTLYVVTPFPNRVHAFDLNAPQSGPKWTYAAQVETRAQGAACCDVVNRGAAYDSGRIFFNTLDNHTIALDAETGRELWNVKLGDSSRGETMTMAPLVVKDRVLVGNSGGELGVRGWLTALEPATGAIAWRAYSTGPDADVLIGPEFKPYYASDRGSDLGVHSWPPDRWKTGGGTAWGFISYDPELDLLFYGTANPGPWNGEQRHGDNKWTSGIFARRPADGHAVWFYQWSPHDLYDYDGVNESVLVDADTASGPKRLLFHADRNGYLYVLDRASGQVLSAVPFAHVNTSSGVDLTSGRLKYVTEKEPHVGQTVHDVCPAAPGAKDWQPMAFSPRTSLLYIPHNNLCEDETGTSANFIPGTPYLGKAVKMRAGPGGKRGVFTAWDPFAARAVWRTTEDFPVWSGALVTGSDLVFYGTMDGRFRAVDARTGKRLWERQLDSGVIGQPVTYRGPDGKQYVAVFSGVGGWAGALVPAKLDVTDPTAGDGFVNAMHDLPTRTKPGGTLYVFALP